MPTLIRLINNRYFTVLIFLPVAFIGITIPVNAQVVYDVRGYVVNETKDSVIPDGLEIILHTFDPDGGPVETNKTIVDSDGYFEFIAIQENVDLKYFITVEHDSFKYNKEILPDALGDPVKITVYDKTRDPTVVTFDTHIFVVADVSPADQNVSIVEFIKFTNNSDKTLIPDIENVPPISFIRFSMPDNFSDLDVQTDLPGGQIISVGTGFAVTSPITPGKHQISFSYVVGYNNNGFSYDQKMIHGAEFFQAMVPKRLSGVDIDISAESTDLDIEGTKYSAWNLYDVPANSGPFISIGGLPDSTILDTVLNKLSDKNFWRLLIPIGILILLLITVPFLVFKIKNNKLAQ